MSKKNSYGSSSRGMAYLYVVLAVMLGLIVLVVVGGKREGSNTLRRSKEEAQVSQTRGSGFKDIITSLTPTLADTQRIILPSEEPTSALLTPVPTLTLIPTPTVSLIKETYTVIISESELNTALRNAVVGNDQSGENPIEKVTITLEKEIGMFEVYWKKGQTLTAQMRVASTRTDLTIDNLQVTGAGLLTGLFEQLAYDALNRMVKEFTASQANKLERIEIRTGELVLFYRLGQ